MPRFLSVLTLLPILLLAAPGAAQPVRVSVDASKSIGPVNPIYRDFGQGGEHPDPEYLSPLVARMKALKPRIVRIDHVFDYYCKCEVRDGRLIVDFTNLDRYIDSIIAMGAKPLMSLSYMPEPLHEKWIQEPPKDPKLWIDLVRQTVKHFNVDRKLGIQYWEMWNEPNDVFWHAGLERYLELYTATAKAATDADPTIKFGGPGAAGWDQKWIQALIDHARKDNARLDFVSWHNYHDNAGHFTTQINQTRAWLTAANAKAETMINEWNYDAGMEPENDDHRGAAHITYTLCNMMNLPLDYAPFFEIKDGPDKAGKRYWGRWGLFTVDNHPKANYYAFCAFARLAGEKLKFERGSPAVGGIAMGKSDKLGIILYNTNRRDTTPVELQITGLSTAKAAVTRFLIDETHSNPVKQGHDSKLEQVESPTAAVADGTLKTTLTLPPSSVTLLELAPEAPAKK